MISKITAVALFIFSFTHLSGQIREDHLLNTHWKFIFNYQVDKNAGMRVDLPHTWNKTDALNGQLNYYRGAAIYQKRLPVQQDWKGKRLFLKFDGVNTVTDVFINGKYVGEHRGGYAAFLFEITDAVHYGEENEIMVRVTNALNLDVMPLVGDFNFYGGIFRDVHLLLTEPNCISPLDYASPGVYLTQKKVNREIAEVGVKVLLDFLEAAGNGDKIQINIKSGNTVVLSKDIPIKKGKKGAFEILTDFVIRHPHLWNGREDPFLYTAEIILLSNNAKIDQVTQSLGLRSFYIDAKKGAFLNGRAIHLNGVCRHEDYMGSGNALAPWQQEEDVAILMDMGANAIRLSHYPPAPYFYQLLDEHGIMAWSEIPFVGPGGYNFKGFVDQTSFRENGKQQLKELIRQHYNHPSVLMWGLYNELNVKGDNPTAYVEELNRLAHEEDPSRPTVSANNIDDIALTGVTDLNAWNRYDGWYGGKPQDIGTWADDLHTKRPNLKLAISEYGAGASIYHHDDQQKKPEASSYWHPEGWQAYYHEENWKTIQERPFIWGSFLWNLFDFGAAHRREGDRDGVNDKGLVTYDRKEKKDAWWFYKAAWRTDIPVLHLNDKRFVDRSDSIITVKAYSNAGPVTLWINGKNQGSQQPNGVIVQWPKMMLSPGKNEVVIRMVKDKSVVDSCVWYLKEII